MSYEQAIEQQTQVYMLGAITPGEMRQRAKEAMDFWSWAEKEDNYYKSNSPRIKSMNPKSLQGYWAFDEYDSKQAAEEEAAAAEPIEIVGQGGGKVLRKYKKRAIKLMGKQNRLWYRPSRKLEAAGEKIYEQGEGL